MGEGAVPGTGAESSLALACVMATEHETRQQWRSLPRKSVPSRRRFGHSARRWSGLLPAGDRDERPVWKMGVVRSLLVGTKEVAGVDGGGGELGGLAGGPDLGT